MRVDEAEVAERAPRGKKRFTQVYDKGWDTIAHLAENAMALRVYTRANARDQSPQGGA